MKKLEGKVLLVTEDELRKEVAQWYSHIMVSDQESATEMLLEGNDGLGSILSSGINHMDHDTLIGEAEGWAEMTADSEELVGIVVEWLDGIQEVVAKFEDVGSEKSSN